MCDVYDMTDQDWEDSYNKISKQNVELASESKLLYNMLLDHAKRNEQLTTRNNTLNERNNHLEKLYYDLLDECNFIIPMLDNHLADVLARGETHGNYDKEYYDEVVAARNLLKEYVATSCE